MEWILFEKKLPTNVKGEQIDILFGHPNWATYFRGMYKYFPSQDFRYCLSVYNQDVDRMYDYYGKLPTHYCILPENPKFSIIDIKEDFSKLPNCDKDLYHTLSMFYMSEYAYHTLSMSYMSEDKRFGKTKNYQKGDIVVWKGNMPCIGKISRNVYLIEFGDINKIKFSTNEYYINESHNSLHYSNLRLADEEEIKILGNNDIILINQNPL